MASATPTGATAPTASVIIVNYNAGDRLRRCLQQLTEQTVRDFETIIIDNDSADDSLDLAAPIAGLLGARIIRSGINLGFAAGNNRAVAEARGRWIAFLNPDAYAEPGWLEALMAATVRYPWAAAFGSTQISAGAPDRLDGAGDAYHVFGVGYRGHFGWPLASLPPDGECFAPCAAAALYRREVFDALGGFDERFFCYGEDVDLGFRLRLAGERAVQVAAAVVHHEGSGISGRYSDFTVYHGNRNRIWLAYKNTPGPLYWPFLPLHLLVNAYLFMRAISIGGGGAYWRAMRDAYGGLGAFGADRRRIAQSRRASLVSIARAMAWSPLKVMRRESVLRRDDRRF